MKIERTPFRSNPNACIQIPISIRSFRPYLEEDGCDSGGYHRAPASYASSPRTVGEFAGVLNSSRGTDIAGSSCLRTGEGTVPTVVETAPRALFRFQKKNEIAMMTRRTPPPTPPPIPALAAIDSPFSELLGGVPVPEILLCPVTVAVWEDEAMSVDWWMSWNKGALRIMVLMTVTESSPDPVTMAAVGSSRYLKPLLLPEEQNTAGNDPVVAIL